MQPEQPLQPSPQQPPSLPPAASNHKMILIIVLSVVGGLVILGGIIAVSFVLLWSGSKPASPKASSAQSLTIGTQLYLYPCTVATQADFARSFGLEDGKIGSVDQDSALSTKDISGGSDLSKLAPSSSSIPWYITRCSYTLANKDHTSTKSIEVKLSQFSKESDAKEGFDSMRATESDDITFDNVDNGTRQLSTLPSFGAGSFVRLPDADLHTEKAAILVGTRTVELSFSLEPTDTVAAITPMLDAYAKAIKANILAAKASQPVDFTGHATAQNKAFVDLCQRTDLKRLTSIFAINLRPDDMTNNATFGVIPGSDQYDADLSSSCEYGFQLNDRQSTSSSPYGITTSQKWPHQITMSADTYPSATEARNRLDNAKSGLSRPVGDTVPTITDKAGIGDGAFSYHSESSHTNTVGRNSRTYTLVEDSIYIAKDSDFIVVRIQYSLQDEPASSVPTPSDQQFKDAYAMIVDTLTKNRSHK